ncbi:hypothetical protein EYB53_017195 [Candidatus Chloroploca sp. M-50]|uniref:Uncharacterized protein n=1 Tax=Candidatus Chloroploca mongolica TaxID=2528176 RepID=A0ABS4DDD3_9CHLR|nr:hypothetical protein [Candidatus Chloroploca mongolica]MBP1467453.1 hypothetical protein [Candidatus Chloroploca mongolica]
MRQLSDTFKNTLQHGFLRGLTTTVQQDKDLDLHIRDNYINVYYKGNALLKLTEKQKTRYQVEIHAKFLEKSPIPDLIDEDTTQHFLTQIPRLKAAISQHGKSSLEIEYEQLIIRANNREPRNTVEYFIVDRQYAINDARFDLTGIFWSRTHRKIGQQVNPCLMEVKFALNTDIKEIHLQIQQYYHYIKHKSMHISKEIETLFHQKLDLGLYEQGDERLKMMRTLTVSPNIDDFYFLIILVDYNPYSKLLPIEELKRLSFSNQIRIQYSGFAMWERNIQAFEPYSP